MHYVGVRVRPWRIIDFLGVSPHNATPKFSQLGQSPASYNTYNGMWNTISVPAYAASNSNASAVKPTVSLSTSLQTSTSESM
jgi:hypothetical protein